MSTHTTHRSRARTIAHGLLACGLLLATAGLAMAPAGAATKTNICHATSAVGNPYQALSVDLSSTSGPDHATHVGLVFDPAVNLTNKPAWGDIIPGGLNSDTVAGAARLANWENDCLLPGEVPDPDPEVCPWDDSLTVLDEGCVEPDPEVCPWDDSLTVEDEGCVEPDPEVCPWDDSLTVEDEACVEPDPEIIPALVIENSVEKSVEKAPVQVEGLVLTRAPAPAPTPAPAVAATTASPLPRTGSNTVPLTQVGFGLVLLGVGALLQGRERTAEI